MSSLAEAGWSLSDEGLALCEGQAAKALNLDLREIGKECLPETINRGKPGNLEGGPVLQVTKVRNITAPKANEDSQAAPRMLKISLTDGSKTVHGVEMSKLDGIGINTAPGTKVKLAASVPYSNGHLRLEPGSIKVIGGRVDELAEKWEFSQKMAKFTRNFSRTRPAVESGDGPPPWISFGKKRAGPAEADKNFKSLPDQEEAKLKEASENVEFDSQRQDAINEASKTGQKVFGGGTKEIKEGRTNDKRSKRLRGPDDATSEARVNGSSDDHSNKTDQTRRHDNNQPSSAGHSAAEESQWGGRKGRRGRQRDDADEGSYSAAKPSSGLSLFDFLGEKFPDGKAKENGSSAVATAASGEGNQSGVRSKDDRAQKSDQKGKRQQQQGEGHYRDNPGRGGPNANRKDHHNAPSSQTNHWGGRRGGGNGASHDNRANYQKPPRQQNLHQQQHNAGGGGGGPPLRGGRGGGQRHNGGNHRASSGRDFGEWSNSTYHESQRHHHREALDSITATLNHLNLGNNQRHQQQQAGGGGQRSNRRPDQQLYGHPGNRRTREPDNRSARPSEWADSTKRPDKPSTGGHGWATEPSQFVPKNPEWRVGDSCLAKYWEDNNFYSVRVTAVTKKTAVVLFTEYGNHEEVLLTDLLPFPMAQQQRAGFIPTTPGLPPAFPQS